MMLSNIAYHNCISLVLQDLHWLSECHQGQLKVLLLTYKTQNGLGL